MTRLLIVLGAALAGVAALADLQHFERLKFIATPKWTKVRAVLCLLGIGISATAGIYADWESEAREKERDASSTRLAEAQETIRDQQTKIVDQQGALLSNSKLTMDQQLKIIEILESPPYRGLPREKAFNKFVLTLTEELKVQSKATAELATEVQRGGQYRPLSPEIGAAVLARLQPVARQARDRGVRVSLFVQAHSDDENRVRVVRDLEAMLTRAGFRVSTEAIQVVVGGSVGTAAAICYHPSNEAVAHALTTALEPMVQSPWAGVADATGEKCPRDVLRMKISAVPRFNYRDGTVELR